MKAVRLVAAAIMLAACQPEAPSDANEAAANSVGQHSGDCARPKLALADGARLDSALFNQAEVSFTAAYDRACAKGWLNGTALFDAKAADQGRLFLVNAPEANIASIYLSEVDGNHMVLEYPFLTVDGKSQVPSADELEEAIYCVVVGATPEEQDGSGRCLVD